MYTLLLSEEGREHCTVRVWVFIVGEVWEYCGFGVGGSHDRVVVFAS